MSKFSGGPMSEEWRMQLVPGDPLEVYRDGRWLMGRLLRCTFGPGLTWALLEANVNGTWRRCSVDIKSSLLRQAQPLQPLAEPPVHHSPVNHSSVHQSPVHRVPRWCDISSACMSPSLLASPSRSPPAITPSRWTRVQVASPQLSMTHHDLFAHNGGREGHPRAACQSVPKLRTADALDEQCRSVPAPLATRWVEIPQENPSPCKAGNAQNSRIMVKPPANEGETTKLVKDTGQTTPTLCRPLEPRNRAEVAKDVKSQEMPRLRSARHQENKNSQDSAPPAFAWQRTATPPHQPQQLVPKQSP